MAWTSQHEGNLMKLAGCPLVKVQWTLFSGSSKTLRQRVILGAWTSGSRIHRRRKVNKPGGGGGGGGGGRNYSVNRRWGL